MGDVGSAYFLGVLDNFQGLNHAFSADRQWVGIVFKHIAENQVTHYFGVKAAHRVDGGVTMYPHG